MSATNKALAGILGVFLTGLMFAVPIAMIVLGAEHYDQCPMQPWIPKFMIVSGAVTIGFVLLGLSAIGCNSGDRGGFAMCFMVLALLAGLFLFGWTIAGSVWVFKEWKNWDDIKNDMSKSCHNDTYLFAFALLIIFWVSIPCQCGASSKANSS